MSFIYTHISQRWLWHCKHWAKDHGGNKLPSAETCHICSFHRGGAGGKKFPRTAPHTLGETKIKCCVSSLLILTSWSGPNPKPALNPPRRLFPEWWQLDLLNQPGIDLQINFRRAGVPVGIPENPSFMMKHCSLPLLLTIQSISFLLAWQVNKLGCVDLIYFTALVVFFLLFF